MHAAPPDPHAAAAPTAASPPTPPRRLRRWVPVAMALLVLPPLLAALAVAGAWRALHHEAGTRWALAQVAARLPGLELGMSRGALLGGGFELDRLALQAGRLRVQVEGLRLDGLAASRFAVQPPYVHLQAQRLAAHRIDVTRAPADAPAAPAAPPASLRLPFSAELARLEVERLHLPGVAAPIESLSAKLDAGPVHRANALTLRWNGLQAGGQLQIGAEAGLDLAGRLALAPDPTAPPEALPAWARGVALDLRLRGPLQGFDLAATLTAQSQRLDATGQVAPFEAMPLTRLDARFAELDLARLLAPFTAAAPTTQLTGRARLELREGEPLHIEAQAVNARPGRWDQQRLPLRELDLQAHGQGQRWTIATARLQLGAEPRGDAGRLSASGELDAGRGRIRLQLDGLQPQALDRRGPPLRLGGPVDLSIAAAADGAGFGRVDLDARLAGALLGEARARVPAPLRDTVQLALRGHATPDAVVVDALEARAGTAHLDGQGRARRAGAAWDGEAALRLAGFDPALWLPGEPDAAWRRRGNALNGRIDARGRVPAAAADARAWLAALAGSLSADLTDSRLAGQPLALKLELDADGAGRIDARGQARAATNHAALELALRPAGGDDLAEIKLDAPALDQLAPLAEALGLGPLAGRAQIDARVEGALGALLAGRAGTLATRGTLQIGALQIGALRLAEASGGWQATLPGGASASAALADARIEASLQARELRLPGLTLPEAELQAGGSLAEHRATLRATLRQPAAPGNGVGAPAPGAPLQLDARLAGAWRAGSPHSWQAAIDELRLRPQPAASQGAEALPLFSARGLGLNVEHGGGLLRATLAPGRAEVLGAALRWSQAQVERRDGAEPQAALQAEVEPFAVAALLQRLQPDFGWGGDLRVGARIALRSQPAVTARIEFARSSGDLQVSEFGVVQTLGLSEARLALDAEGGLWSATQRLVGANLGRIDGEQRLRTEPTRLWPGADAALAGRLGAQVENLAAWGAWVPAGWRLGGRLDAELSLAGRLGAPQATGTVSGRDLALRHALEGVALTEGMLAARFEGARARLEALSFKAGDGTLRVSGEAELGDAPRARLQAVAERALLLGRVDRRVVASGQASLQIERDKLTMRGALRADEGLVDFSRGDAPSLGDDVTVRRSGTDDAAAAQAARRNARAVDLDLAVDLGPRFRLRGRGLETRLAGSLQLATPGGRLLTRGEIRTAEGSYEAYGQRLAIERGVVTFVGSVDNPRLDIEAVRANTDVRVGVRVTGNVQQPRVRLFSEPELPDTEKLALLVTGRRYDSLAGADTLLLQRAAFALLAGDGGESGTLDLAGLLQLDELSVRQTDGVVRDTVVTLGKQISDRVYLGYERGLNAAAGNWQLIYRIAQRFTLRAQSGEDPALDLIWIFRWN